MPASFAQVLATSPQQWKGELRFVDSPGYNTIFNYVNGAFARWGNTISEDPQFSPLGPEILDLEISTICNGIQGKPCPWCYKGNTAKGQNMSFDSFQRIFHKMPKNLTQIAFGIGDIDANPDLWRMFEYCRDNDYNRVVPNVTINGWNLTKNYAQRLANLCGAVSVSHYEDDVCFNAVHLLTESGVKQVNIHQLMCEESYNDIIRLFKAISEDTRLYNLHAIILLSLKRKGRGIVYNPLSPEKFRSLVSDALAYKIPIGFDSCTAPRFLALVRDDPKRSVFQTLTESCESTLFSAYINFAGKFFPCSFTEDEDEWQEGIDVTLCQNFLQDVWNHTSTRRFREKLLATATKNQDNCRECPVFDINLKNKY